MSTSIKVALNILAKAGVKTGDQFDALVSVQKLAKAVPPIPADAATVWGTDYWGSILSEPTEAHARMVAEKYGVKLFRRVPGSAWELVEK